MDKNKVDKFLAHLTDLCVRHKVVIDGDPHSGYLYLRPMTEMEQCGEYTAFPTSFQDITAFNWENQVQVER